MDFRTTAPDNNNDAMRKLRKRKGRGGVEPGDAGSQRAESAATMVGNTVSGASSPSSSLSTSPSTHSSPKSLYGDMVGMCTGFVIVPDLGWKLYKVMAQTNPQHPKRVVAPYVYGWWIGTISVHFCAHYLRWRGSHQPTKTDPRRVIASDGVRLFLSRLAFFGCIFGSALMDVADWPYTGESTITRTLQHGIVIGVLANVSLSFREKIVRLALLFLVGSLVSIHSPYSVYTEDALPVLGGSILLAVFGLYCVAVNATRGIATVVLARLVLAAIYIHHTVGVLAAINLGEGFSARDNMAAMIRASVIACIGIVATGTFQEEIWHKEQLEVLIRDRTNELRTQHEELNMVNMALQATETAITITNERGRIIWFNNAFEQMGNNKSVFERRGGGTLVGCALKNVIYNIDPTQKNNKYILIEALDDVYGDDEDCDELGGGDRASDAFVANQRREDEIKLGASVFQLEATPFLYSGHAKHPGSSPTKRKDRRVLVVFKDVTELRARERAEKKARDEAMMTKAMGDSMVTLTHELRTPLQGIMGITSLLLQSGAKDEISLEATESLRLIMASSSLLLNLINNLLDVKKANSKMLGEFPLASILAAGPIKDSMVFCRPLASISNVELVMDTSLAPNAFVRSNSLRLQQVLINLISNAIKYTSRGSSITIRTHESTKSEIRSKLKSALASSSSQDSSSETAAAAAAAAAAERDGTMLVFSVSDNGPGITPDQAHRLFRRFAQLDTQPTRTLGSSTVGQPSGTGLGLHLCELFVRRMDGHIWATNNGEGQGGCTFSFSLPLSSNNAPRRTSLRGMRNLQSLAGLDQAVSEALSGSESSSNDDQHRVLLVDDTLINRKVISRILKRVGFTDVSCVDSGPAALKELSELGDHYDLVMTDLQMPGMSGTELAQAIFDSTPANGLRPPPIVIGITADTGSDVATRCRVSGMSDLLYKPITVEDMKDFVKMRIPHLQPSVWYDDEDETMKFEHPSQ